MRRLRDESGMTIVELIVVCAVLVIVMGALSNVFISGLRASSDGQARLAAQEKIRTALDRLEYEARCAQTATIVSGGAGVALSLPGQCPHATGNVAWCVSGGTLQRVAGATDCSLPGQTFVEGVASATPFSCLAPVGPLPQLQVALTVTAASSPGASTSATDTITLRNAQYTTSTFSSCT